MEQVKFTHSYGWSILPALLEMYFEDFYLSLIDNLMEAVNKI